MVERNSGKIEVIVAGGSLPGSELSTEIFSVTDNRWRTGPKLPQAIVYGVSVPYRSALSTYSYYRVAKGDSTNTRNLKDCAKSRAYFIATYPHCILLNAA